MTPAPQIQRTPRLLSDRDLPAGEAGYETARQMRARKAAALGVPYTPHYKAGEEHDLTPAKPKPRAAVRKATIPDALLCADLLGSFYESMARLQAALAGPDNWARQHYEFQKF
jgi:hypothetical protein